MPAMWAVIAITVATCSPHENNEKRAISRNATFQEKPGIGKSQRNRKWSGKSEISFKNQEKVRVCVVLANYSNAAFSALTLLVGRRKGICPLKNK